MSIVAPTYAQAPSNSPLPPFCNQLGAKLQVDYIPKWNATATDRIGCLYMYGIGSNRFWAQVGRPYINGSGCPVVWDKMQQTPEYDLGLCIWKATQFCTDDTFGGTGVSFEANETVGKKQAETLLKAGYPELEFDCQPRWRPET